MKAKQPRMVILLNWMFPFLVLLVSSITFDRNLVCNDGKDCPFDYVDFNISYPHNHTGESKCGSGCKLLFV